MRIAVSRTARKEDKIMNKQEIYAYLKRNHIWHEITEHKAVYSMAELSQVDVPYPEADAKIFLYVTTKKEIIT